MKKGRTKKILIIAALVIVAGWMVLFFAKDWFLGIAIRNAQHKLKDKYKIEVSLKSYVLHGWKEVELNGVDLRSLNHDTIAYLNHIQLKVKLWPLISGKIRLEKMQMDNGMLNLNEISKLRQKKTLTGEKDSNLLVKSQKYIRLIQDAANVIPDDFIARKIAIFYSDSSGDVKGYIDSASYHDSRLSILSELLIKDQNQTWMVNGTFDKSNLETHLAVKSNVTGVYQLSMIKKIASAEIGFRSYTIDLFKLEDNGDNVNINGSLKARNIRIYNPRIAADTVLADSGGIDFR